MWADNSWFLFHHGNAPSNTALVLRNHFAKNLTHIVPQPPYSPNLATCDFWLFPKLKRPLRGQHFDTIQEIQAESKKALKAIYDFIFKIKYASLFIMIDIVPFKVLPIDCNALMPALDPILKPFFIISLRYSHQSHLRFFHDLISGVATRSAERFLESTEWEKVAGSQIK